MKHSLASVDNKATKIDRFGAIKSGSWWVEKESKNNEPVFISNLKMLGDVVHTVVIYSDENVLEDVGYEKERCILVDDFLNEFIQYGTQRALRYKQTKIIELQDSISQRALDLSNKDRLKNLGKDKTKEEMSKETELVVGQKLELLNLKNTRLAIEEQKKLIKQDSKKLGRRAKELAQNQKAQFSGVFKIVEKINNKIFTLDMYIGDDVEIIKIKDGKPAPASEKITMIQEKIFMDEESLINTVDGGATYEDEEEFYELIRTDKKLLERILPFNKCVVVMRFRRKDKCIESDELAEHIANYQENAGSRREFILIRNGDKVFSIFSPVEHLRSLFPIESEIKDFYKDWGSDVVDINSVNFVDSHDKHILRLEHYKRIFIMLIGCYERQADIFSPLKTETKTKKANLFDINMHNMLFERFYGFDNRLEDKEMPTFKEFICAKNACIKKGSIVAIIINQYCDNYFDEDEGRTTKAPSIFRFVHDSWSRRLVKINYSCNYEEGVVAKVRDSKDKQYISIPVTREVWRKYEGYHHSTINAKVFITPAFDNGLVEGIVCLDDITINEIMFYLNHKTYRKDYLLYVPVFKLAYQYLIKQEKG